MGRGIRGLLQARSLRALLALAALVGPPGLASPAAADPGDPALPARLFEALGVRAQLEAIAPIAVASLLGAPAATPADQRALERIVRAGFAADRIERAALHALLPGFDLPHARDAVRWLASPAARKLLATSPRCVAGAGTRVSRDRRAAIARIDAVFGDPDHASGQARRVLESMRAVAAERLPVSPWPEPTVVERAAPPAIPASTRCGLDALTDDELASALRFVESEAGRWLLPAVSRALEDAIAGAARRTVRTLLERFEGRPPSPPVRVARAGDPVGAPPVSAPHGRRAPHG